MKYDFIEIGTSDFDTLLQSSSTEIGLSIEPIKIYLDNLPDKSSLTQEPDTKEVLRNLINCGYTIVKYGNYNITVERP